MRDLDSRKWIIASVFVCIFLFLVFDELTTVRPVHWSSRAKVRLDNAVKQCFVARANGMEVEKSRVDYLSRILFLNRPGVSRDCSFVVKAVDYPWWDPARFNSKRWRPESETWFAIEGSYGDDAPLKELCGDASKPGCKDGGQWQPVVDNRD